MKNILKNLSFLSIISLVLISFSVSCHREKPKWRIGVAQCSDDEWRSQMNEEIRREMLFHDDATVEIRCANDSSERQIADIDYFIDNRFDIIVVAPNEAEALTPAVRKAYSKGIPVIIFDRAVNDSSYTTYIELDNAGVGRNAAIYAARILRQSGGEVMEITGSPGSSPAEERHNGFMSVLDSIGDIPIAGSFHGNWRGKTAYRITDSVMRLNPDIKLIYAHNDVMAMSAARAAKDLGRNDVVVIGTDGAPGLGVKAVADSVIDATFIYPTVGDRVITAAIDILNGRSYPRVDHIPSTDFIDHTNAEFHIRQNELLRKKTNQIEEINSKYTFTKSLNAQQNIFLIACMAVALLLGAGVAGLLYFLRQKNRLQKELLEKNNRLTEWGERQAALYSRLEEATHEKLVFFTNVSHDLLTPLVLIAEPIDMLAAENGISDSARSLLLMMKRNVGILKRMIEQILDFRKYQNGKTTLNFQEANPESLVEDWARLFTNTAARKNIKYELDIRDSGLTMAVDIEKLERIFFNLISNAFKYTPPRGTVRVVCSMDQFHFRLTVTDTGRGMSQNELERIFERYYRINGAGAKGVGIGLALTKAFVELMAGEIKVESMPDKGSSFTVTIPVRHIDTLSESPVNNGVSYRTEIDLTDESSQETGLRLPVADISPVSDSEKPLMLVIDDNEDIRSLVRMICEEEYDVIEAADGKEGIRKAVKYVPDIIVCDIMMPEMDGLEATRRIKEERATSHIPVLILTASRLDEQRVKSYDSGADGYISKPFTEEMLKARSRNLIANRKRIFDLFLEGGCDKPGKQKKDGEKESPLSIDNDFYRDFLTIVRANISDENLSVKEIASRLGIGPTQLTRKIKSLTGTTAVEIIRELRLREGRNLLITTDRPIADIAFSLGFSSPQYFARCFREKYDKTPTELRASVR